MFKNIAKSVNFNSLRTLLPLFLIGFILRYAFSRFGHNYDYDSWVIVGEITSRAKNIFAETSRYNYGFIWAYLLGIYYFVTTHLGFTLGYYRALIILTLTLADLGISYYIYRKSNSWLAILFFLNPVSLIISGYHNQFDNIAVCLALFAMLNLEKAIESNRMNRYDVFSITLFSLSLITKHIIFIFPLWLLFRSDLGVKRRLIYFIFPPLFFALNFVLFLPDGLVNIRDNVFGYDSFNNMPLITLFLPASKVYLNVYFRNLFMLIMVIVGFVFRKSDLEKILMFYMLSMFAFASAMAVQYLIIPLAALFVLGKRERVFYLVLMSTFLVLHFDGLNVLNNFNTWVQSNPSSHLYNSLNAFVAFIYDFVVNGYTLATWIVMITLMRELKITKYLYEKVFE